LGLVSANVSFLGYTTGFTSYFLTLSTFLAVFALLSTLEDFSSLSSDLSAFAD